MLLFLIKVKANEARQEYQDYFTSREHTSDLVSDNS